MRHYYIIWPAFASQKLPGIDGLKAYMTDRHAVSMYPAIHAIWCNSLPCRPDQWCSPIVFRVVVAVLVAEWLLERVVVEFGG